MNANDVRVYKSYKIKNIYKANRAVESLSDISKPVRYMEDIKAQFVCKKMIIFNEPNIFSESLSGMTPNDIDLNEAAKNVKKPSVDFVRYFILLVSLGVFVFSGYKMAGMLYEYVLAAKEYSSLQYMFVSGDDAFEGTQSLRKTKTNAPLKDHMALQRQKRDRTVGAEAIGEIGDIEQQRMSMVKFADKNPDMYGWIRVSHTTINYPVVQTTDNEHYLNYSFEGKYNKSGAIFADWQNSRDVSLNYNTVIYGHNMLDRSMFQPLIDFGTRIDYFRDGIIELITAEATYYYEIFSVREEDPASGYIETNFYERDEENRIVLDEEGNPKFDAEIYLDFLKTMKERSIFQKNNIVFDEESRIITLSTCVNDIRRDWRFVVQGILFDVR